MVGNVYFTNHLKWQGICRELFLQAHVPEVIQQLVAGTLAFVTVRCGCDYKSELLPMEKVAVRMTLEALGSDSASMRFDYWRLRPDGGEDLIAIGRQETASRRRTEHGLVSTPQPKSLHAAQHPKLRHDH